MKKFILQFIQRGLMAFGFGPIVLVIIYAALYQSGTVSEIPVPEMIRGILSISLLAFIAGGINAIYQVEEIPLMWAILIHGGILYLDYIIIYLTNGWLKRAPYACLIFTVCFLLGYAVIWTAIYFLVIKSKTEKLNRELLQRQERGR